MLKTKRAKSIFAIVLALVVLVSATATALFTDRVNHKMTSTTATFTKDGYKLETTHLNGPFVAGEDVTVTLKESNAKQEDIQSVIMMTAKWKSPDTTSVISNNSKRSNDLSITVDDGPVGYTMDQDGNILISLTKQTIKADSSKERTLTFHIPDSLGATGQLSFAYEKVTISQVSDGFSVELSKEDLNASEKLDFSVKVGWDLGKTIGEKSLMGYLESTDTNDEYGFILEGSGAMHDWNSDEQDALPHVQYADSVVKLTLPNGLTTIGDCAFKDFSSLTTLTIPASVVEIGSQAFYGATSLKKITFNHGKSDSLVFPEAGANTGAFYVKDYLETDITTENDAAKAYRWAADNRAHLVLSSITIKTPPNKITYSHGEDFDASGMVVTATYDDGSTKAVTGYTVIDGTSLSAGKTSVTISYSERGITKTTTQAITVNKVLSSIKVTTAPTKTTYNHGDSFDKTGMVVTATYTDGSTAAVTNYSVQNGTSLSAGQESVTISYTENGVTKKTTQAITVNKVLSSIKVTTAPTKTTYNHGDSFDKTGMVVTATYTNDSTAIVSSYSIQNGTSLSAGQTSVTISYTENGVTKTATQAITVKNPLTGIAVTTAPTKTSYSVGENFSASGMIVTATYSNGSTKAVTGYTITDGDSLTLGKTFVTISYTEDSITKTTTQAITVIKSLGSLDVGNSVYLNENGVPQEYLIVHQGTPSSLYDSSCDGIWLLRKDIHENRLWDSIYTNENSYKASTIHAYLNSAFLGMFDADIQAAIKQVKIPYVNGTGHSAVASGANGLSTKVFLLSGYEVGWTQSDSSDLPIDGAKLDYFSSGTGAEARSLRVANLNGSATSWWLRSPYTANVYKAFEVWSEGSWSHCPCAEENGVRPALVLPFDAQVDDDGNVNVSN